MKTEPPPPSQAKQFIAFSAETKRTIASLRTKIDEYADAREALKPVTAKLAKVNRRLDQALTAIAAATGMNQLVQGHSSLTFDQRVAEAIKLRKGGGDSADDDEDWLVQLRDERRALLKESKPIEARIAELEPETISMGGDIAIAAVEALEALKLQVAGPAIDALEALGAPRARAIALVGGASRIAEIDNALARLRRYAGIIHSAGEAGIVLSFAASAY